MKCCQRPNDLVAPGYEHWYHNSLRERACLQALLHSARDQAEIQLRNTAIQALQPPRNSAGRNPRTSTRFWERDVFVPGSNNQQFRGNFRVPVFQAFPASTPPVNPSDYLPSQSEAFDATWVPRYMVRFSDILSYTQRSAVNAVTPW